MKRLIPLFAALAAMIPGLARACTGISLKSTDGAAIVGRTVEWSLNDSEHHRLAIFPRNKSHVAQTPDGYNGLKWTGRYGFVSMSAYGQPYGPDGLNEKGLSVAMYYFPGFASYMPYDKTKAAQTLSVGDFMQWMLSSFSTVDEVRAKLNSVRVVNVDDPQFHGVPLPFHWKVADPTGSAIVIEMVENGKVNVYDAFLGVITNSPGYDWHLTNLRNYLHLTSEPRVPLTIGKLELGPLGAGSGMIGLPGDFTPPSRFVRAAALTASARPLADARAAVFEAFRILDSFDIPVGAVVPRKAIPGDIESATQITSVSDLQNARYYFTTMRNREVRMIDLKKIDFAKVREQIIDGDEGRLYPVRELTVR